MKPTNELINWNEFSESLTKRYIKQAKIIFKHKEELAIKSDLDLLDAIFTNLISNSISFSSKEEAQIFIEVEESHKQINISYKDIGKGIDKYTASSIFTPFIKSPESEGLGLGMTIVARSIERLGGVIECIPSEEGAHFEIKIPSL